MLPTFTGVGVYTGKEKFHKIAFSDIEKGKASYPKTSDDGWIAMLQHYFLGAWLPKNGTPREFYVRKVEGLYAAGVIVRAPAIQPGASATLDVPLYAGPQEQDKLAKLAPGLDLSVDYGWLTIIAVPLFWVLSWMYQWVGNWGVAIILLTVIIKLIFYPLSEASYRSMARMRVVAPKLQRLKEQYGDDKQRMQQAMMELYKTEKINPLGGCFPIVVQIPVFIALYWVLLASVELRHAPFMLWIRRLVAPRSVFRAADPHGCHDDHSDAPESRAARPGAGESHEDHADCLQRVLLLFPRWPRAVLAGQQRPVDPAAVAYQSRAGTREPGPAAQELNGSVGGRAPILAAHD